MSPCCSKIQLNKLFPNALYLHVLNHARLYPCQSDNAPLGIALSFQIQIIKLFCNSLVPPSNSKYGWGNCPLKPASTNASLELLDKKKLAG